MAVWYNEAFGWVMYEEEKIKRFFLTASWSGTWFSAVEDSVEDVLAPTKQMSERCPKNGEICQRCPRQALKMSELCPVQWGRFLSTVLESAGKGWALAQQWKHFSTLFLKALRRAELWPNNKMISQRWTWQSFKMSVLGPTMEWFLSAVLDSTEKGGALAQQWKDFSALSLKALGRAELWPNNGKVFQRCPWKFFRMSNQC